MPGFIEGQDRYQVTLLPESLDEFIADDWWKSRDLFSFRSHGV